MFFELRTDATVADDSMQSLILVTVYCCCCYCCCCCSHCWAVTLVRTVITWTALVLAVQPLLSWTDRSRTNG